VNDFVIICFRKALERRFADHVAEIYRNYALASLCLEQRAVSDEKRHTDVVTPVLRIPEFVHEKLHGLGRRAHEAEAP
jgi:hypothetical protein